MKNFYITTPIYYVNDKPHIGHAYTTVLADIMARYHRLLNENVFFLTGTDEHGQKVQKAAEKHDMTSQEQCDATYIRFQELWERLGITNDDFIRTTETRHKVVVREILQQLYEKDLIYQAEYQGRYCVSCERFFTEKDLDEDNACPECSRDTEEIIEKNYFFRMSRYQDWLIDYINSNPDFIQPSFRANETLGFLKKPLEDLCISRPKSRLSWGIELPFDENFVCYVWFDALVNYISAAGYGNDDTIFKKRWPASFHLIGKDILTTHTVYWPTMLKAMGLEMPKTIFAHGWWLMGNSKMSKSLGNVVNPIEMIDKYGVDAFRFFLVAEMSLGQDASFTEEAFILRYNSNLANDLGNLASRVVKMIIKQRNGVLPNANANTPMEEELQLELFKAVEEMEDAVLGMKIDRGIESVMNAVRAGNRYLEKTAPWKLAKEGDDARLNTVLYTVAESLRIISGLLQPIMPEKMSVLRAVLGMPNKNLDMTSLKKWGVLKPGTECKDKGALFPRIEMLKLDSIENSPKKNQKKCDAHKNSKEKIEGIITVDDFFKVKLKTAEVLSAKKVEKADKLLLLTVKLGNDERDIVAGIAQSYKPDELIGKKIVVVSNLKPAIIRGMKSEGMLLAAKEGKKLSLVTVADNTPSGLPVG